MLKELMTMQGLDGETTFITVSGHVWPKHFCQDMRSGCPNVRSACTASTSTDLLQLLNTFLITTFTLCAEHSTQNQCLTVRQSQSLPTEIIDVPITDSSQAPHNWHVLSVANDTTGSNYMVPEWEGVVNSSWLLLAPS